MSLSRDSCFGLTPQMVWVANIADILIGIVYLLMAVILFFLYQVHRRRQLQLPAYLLVWFGAFILCCSILRLTEASMTWWPRWDINVYIRCITAIVSTGAYLSVLRVIFRLKGK